MSLHPKGWKQALQAKEKKSASTGHVQKPKGLIWIPLYTASQAGRKVTLAGRARARLSDQIIARKSLDVKDLENRPIGKIESIRNDSGDLTVIILLNEGVSKPGGKFLLGLRHQGIHVTYALSAATPRAEDETPQAYPGMLGEL